jgi:gelsolin
MLKPENKISWKDSNLALFGSDLEKKIKAASAEKEPAWDGLGTDETLRIWRIEKFLVKDWSKRKYGKVRETRMADVCCRRLFLKGFQ